MKKYISLLLTVFILFSFLSFPAFAQEETDDYSVFTLDNLVSKVTVSFESYGYENHYIKYTAKSPTVLRINNPYNLAYIDVYKVDTWEMTEPSQYLYGSVERTPLKWDDITYTISIYNEHFEEIGTRETKEYPGDEYVDIIGYDKYEGSPTTWGTSAATSLFLTLVNYTNDTKMVALTENDVIPDIQNIVNEGAWWLYFCPWYGEYLMNRNDPVLLNTIYNSKHVITLDELPKDLYDTGNYTPTPTPPKRVVGDLNSDDIVNSIDYALLKSYILGLKPSINLNNADVNGDGEINSIDYAYMKQRLLGIISKFPIE